LVDGRELPWNADPQAPVIFREQVLGFAADADRELLDAALDGEQDPAVLPPAAAILHELVTHDDPRRTAALFAQLPSDVRDHLHRMSPASVAERITVPVVALHDVDDPAVPYGEALRLARALPEARVLTVELFEHVDLAGEQAWHELLGDLGDVWRLTRAVLAPQERWWPR
jgi:fermentation-respiration switch protein FrsA (DUF1100 family)